ncbi:VOC family protein [Skermania piniformis]|uniref:VOC family protein n=1 Tax=Skermania pinensis TaxID=39122 RepID=A0ABX8SDW7_9ACTN|nr:VOC family protein [Skermania piniformis]QXQ15107.1 VOC family protein [Skermania piniformis]
MSERDGYPPGVPAWVTCLVGDLDAAADFYRQVFGWSWNVSTEHDYAVATLRGREVAGIGPVAAAGPDAGTGWVTEVRVEDAAATADAVRAAGGSVLSGPLDLSPASILTVLADPAGAVLCAAQPVGRSGAQLVNEPSTWSMSALSTPDPAAVADFYHTVFGWERTDFGPTTLWQVPGYVGGEPTQPVPRDVVAVTHQAPAPARWGVDFWIADVEAAADAAAAAGGQVITAPADRSGLPLRTALLADPDGSPFSVSQLLP